MTKRIFPIKIEPACLLKWNWSTLFLHQGKSASCHRTHSYDIDPDHFDQFHNLPGKIQDRERMLAGQWPGNGCEYCKNIEDVGGYSDRLMFGGGQEDPAMTPPELFKDATSTSVTPTILEVFFKNTCNMKCIYCGSHFSSLWAEEERKFSKIMPITTRLMKVEFSIEGPHYDQMVAGLWKYLIDQDRYKVLRRYHILGGETFLLSELNDSINFWDQHPNPNLTFSVFSNLNIPHEMFKKYIAKFEKLVFGRKIWKLQLTASIDAWGDEQEYTRYGLDLNLFRKNFEFLLDKPWVSLSINSALSALTIKQVPDLLVMINEWNIQLEKYKRFNIEPIHHTFNTTDAEDNLYIFGHGIFDQDFEIILNLMPDETAIQKNQKDLMQGIATTLSKSSINLEKIQTLKNYLDTLDLRRGTNWRTTFPWLTQIF